jgi:hypothetical protein
VFVDEGENIEVQTTVTNWATREEPVRNLWVLSVGLVAPDAPETPEKPIQRPVGDAGDVFDAAVAVGKPEEAKRLSLALRVAAAALKRQPSIGHTQAQEIVSKWIREARLSEDWGTFFARVNGYMAEHGRTRESVVEALRTIQVGVDNASR